jgi:hypothetical protein
VISINMIKRKKKSIIKVDHGEKKKTGKIKTKQSVYL